MLNLNSVIVLSPNPKGLVDYYKKVFQTEPGWTGGDYSGFTVGSGALVIGPSHKVPPKNANSERVMFNFETVDVKGEFERIKGLGTEVVKEPYSPTEENDSDTWVATFADPDGNYFQIMSPMKDMK